MQIIHGREKKRLNAILAKIFVFLGLVCSPFLTVAADTSAVILVYHRFGEDNFPTTNIRIEQFEAHIETLISGGYSFLSLTEIVQRIKNRQELPPQTVAITVDDAYASVLTDAWPRLKEVNIPLTLFVSTDPVDQKIPGYLSWQQIRELKAEGVDIAHHGAAHLHMTSHSLGTAQADISRASERFSEEIGEVPSLFAYPYGEYNLAFKNYIETQGFEAAFAQVSGPAASTSDMFALPRFAVNERFGDLARFTLITRSIALPVTDITPQEPVLTTTTNPPLFGFTLTEDLPLSGLICYPSHLGRAAERLQLESGRVEIRFDTAFPKGRNRINCTMPAGGGRWYWLGKFFLVPGGTED